MLSFLLPSQGFIGNFFYFQRSLEWARYFGWYTDLKRSSLGGGDKDTPPPVANIKSAHFVGVLYINQTSLLKCRPTKTLWIMLFIKKIMNYYLLSCRPTSYSDQYDLVTGDLLTSSWRWRTDTITKNILKDKISLHL